MYTTALLLALSALTTALPSPLTSRQCTAPTSFQINGFTTFVPAEGNTNPAFVSFTFASSGTSTRCTRNGDITSTTLATCADGETVFRWSADHVLTVGTSYVDCDGNPAVAAGDLGLSVFCFPVVPPVPFGAGTECETPTGQVGGSFTRSSV
ncbi:hypothetical protein HYFRA_00009763 [Hymenoscyphus fraxineus]|uniref:AA1-like domain-containing protein n=1 Tax=Hymenoscyphus fraxineus TaxID=746836 RepID=A0A9N9PR12_9HELO|nr:hypothetical protein HYFRA_00009763 [Hymenoscyphus fraxineus]